ncbi:MAG TPA: hypothetical protein VMX38_20985 [Verrucomicrobiae bacterium]|jgi:hypothetical protein|nr:hypothetical protein [Verrucomicrobiae bacterium]
MKHIMFLAVLFLGVTWMGSQAMAQQDTTSPSTGYNNSRQMSQSSQTNTGAKTSVEGCLSGSNGSYMLTDAQGKSYDLTGDTSKLANHVGHEMKITGTESSGSAAGASSMSNSAGGSQMTIDVTSFKHISKTCKNASGGAMSH